MPNLDLKIEIEAHIEDQRVMEIEGQEYGCALIELCFGRSKELMIVMIEIEA